MSTFYSAKELETKEIPMDCGTVKMAHAYNGILLCCKKQNDYREAWKDLHVLTDIE